MHVHLDGDVEMVNPGPMDDLITVGAAIEANRIVASVSGFMEVDAVTRSIRNMQLATTSACHRGPGPDIPYTTVVYQVARP